MLQALVRASEDGGTGFNPFDGISPDFGPFEGLFTSRIGTFLAIVWAAAFVYVAFCLLLAIARVATSRKGGYGDDLDDARNQLLRNAAAAVLLAAVPVIFGVLVGA
ncbi:hypothetical protein [Solicola sp. PLA-1-18]|uniref:hypothetical protein n=1 Tax=Solicola sp. PLA-1-18 TaxID=3380532 RepID=UPI003B7E46AB